MAGTLSQDEIDQLLTAGGPVDLPDFDLAEAKAFENFENIEAFEQYLTERTYTPEKPYGVFDEDISICRFFSSSKNENLLEDIRRKNEAQGYGNIKIPNTKITLINYSFCTKCKTVFSFKELVDYYMNPKPDPRYKNRTCQYREDTRVYCNNCGAYFLPSLIISDGTPKNEVQFLCRVQTIEAVEKYFRQKNMKVLTENKNNIIQKGKLRAIKNDVFIKDLDEKPTLATNIIQYTPFKYIMNFVDGTNVEKGDLLFDEWWR
ncbi:MAG: hypothetical protein LBL45_13100 [Treponema sp.]|jgi:hypothetical protein|nr:hypothetical protein [Treponema sp.]